MNYIIKISPDEMPIALETSECITPAFIESIIERPYVYGTPHSDLTAKYPHLRLLYSTDQKSNPSFNNWGTMLNKITAGCVHGCAVMAIKDEILRPLNEYEAQDIIDTIEKLYPCKVRTIERNQTMIDNTTFTNDCPSLKESDEQNASAELTPEQQEMASYERSIDFYGKAEAINMAVQTLTDLTKALSEYNTNLTSDSATGASKALVDATRAKAAIVLNQLDVIFGDNSFAEYCRLEDLRDAIEGKAR